MSRARIGTTIHDVTNTQTIADRQHKDLRRVAMVAALAVVLLGTVAALPGDLGRSKKRVKFTGLFAKSPAINRLSAARSIRRCIPI